MSEQKAGSTKILLVEDEVLVRMFAVDVLQDAGFAVIEADSAAEALKQLQTLRNDVQAVVIDLGLPDRPGDALAAEVRALHADLPLLIASGRSEHELKDQFSADKRVAVLSKPYTGPLLIDALASLGVKPPQA
jgi:CheY-like chemotaxis protein